MTELNNEERIKRLEDTLLALITIMDGGSSFGYSSTLYQFMDEIRNERENENE